MVNMIDNIVWTIRYGSYHLIAGDFSWRTENISLAMELLSLINVAFDEVSCNFTCVNSNRLKLTVGEP